MPHPALKRGGGGAQGGMRCGCLLLVGGVPLLALAFARGGRREGRRGGVGIQGGGAEWAYGGLEGQLLCPHAQAGIVPSA